MCLEICAHSAAFRLNAGSDVIGMWQIEATTFAYGHYQVKVTAHGCGFKAALSKSRKTYLGLGLQANPCVSWLWGSFLALDSIAKPPVSKPPVRHSLM